MRRLPFMLFLFTLAIGGRAAAQTDSDSEARAQFDAGVALFEKGNFEKAAVAFARAYDPHTGYMPPQSKEDFDISMRGSLEGIGATLRDDEGYIKVVKVIPGSAADRQGQLQADDVILAVAQGPAEPVDVTDMRLRDAVAICDFLCWVEDKVTRVVCVHDRPGRSMTRLP